MLKNIVHAKVDDNDEKVDNTDKPEAETNAKHGYSDTFYKN